MPLIPTPRVITVRPESRPARLAAFLFLDSLIREALPPMPLPPAPTKRAALLPPEAYDAPARSSHKAARKSEAASTEALLAEQPQAQDDFDAAPAAAT